MKLLTHIPVANVSSPIDYSSSIFTLGSCFAENLTQKLHYFQFRHRTNPFGILFHPRAIENLLQRAVCEQSYSEDELVYHAEAWHCMDAHSRLSSPNKEIVQRQVNDGLRETRTALVEATHIFITLGTAWVYKFQRNSELVANCHKIPQSEFEKSLSSVEEVLASLKQIISHVRSINQKAKIVFTVSPVRHLRDGAVENQRSKAHLISAVHQMRDSTDILYFPAYEIMMDELRDYRYYKADMVHPNQLAVDYIWEKFREAWIAEDAEQTMAEVSAIRKGLEHRPFNPESAQHKAFLEGLHSRMKKLGETYPHMVFES